MLLVASQTVYCYDYIHVMCEAVMAKEFLVDIKIKRRLSQLLEEHPLIQKIVDRIAAEGGRALLVGGAVRDLFLGLPIKDIDIEVHGLSVEKLEKILCDFGHVDLVGKVYGVLRLHPLNADWSVPRIDKPGRKPEVAIDPAMSIKDAFARRDLTINAMGIDLKTGELIDPFDGLHDLKNRILRAPDPKKFIEDPLRFYRVMQFISRFNMWPDDELNCLCECMDVSDVSHERIETELQKMLLKSECPSLGFWWLHDIGRLDLFPQLAALVPVEQDSVWHPEGNVFMHTMQTLDAATTLSYDSDRDKLLVLYAALCHDMGKVETSQMLRGRIRAHGHEQAGARVAARFLKRITRNKDLIAGVQKLTKFHMVPTQLIKPEVKLSAFKRLANKLAPEVTISLLAKLCIADKLGRNSLGREPLKIAGDTEIEQFLERAQKAAVAHQIEKPVLLGRDLLGVVQAGPKMGELLREAYRIQIDEEIKDKEELKRRILKLYRRRVYESE